MITTTTATVTNAIITGLVREGVRTAVERVRASATAPPSKWSWSESALTSHLQWVASWSASIQIGDMARPEPLQEHTIAMGFSHSSAGFRVTGSTEPVLTAKDVLVDDTPYLIEGDPGGGKTTAVKQICRLLLAEPDDPRDQWQYPLLVLLRNLPKRRGLIAHIASLLGLSFELPNGMEMPRDIPSVGGKVVCGGEKLVDAVVRILVDTGAVLLIDGIDELDPEERSEVALEIQDLVHLLARGKIIMTARFGSLRRVFESIVRVQLLPLTVEQQHEIAKLWTDDGGARFFDELSRKPYGDLGSRPLFLVWLLLLFRRDRALPYQPCDMYERSVRMPFEDWDRERDVSRLSQYANFGPDQKLRFLAALSHHLLLGSHEVAFHRRSLEHAYVLICDRFQLPALQAEQVAQEIISHTGLIVQAGFDTYEFSHLSLQEFLCAYYISRDPIHETLQRYLATYPAPLAIAATMSVSPASFLAVLVLNSDRSGVRRDNWGVFLFRLASEVPRFSVSAELGIAALKLISDQPDLQKLLIEAVVRNNSVSVLWKSMAQAVVAYEAKEFDPSSDTIELVRALPLRLPYPLRPPDRLELPQRLISILSGEAGITLLLRDPSSGAGIELLPTEDGMLRLLLPNRQRIRPPSDLD